MLGFVLWMFACVADGLNILYCNIVGLACCMFYYYFCWMVICVDR